MHTNPSPVSFIHPRCGVPPIPTHLLSSLHPSTPATKMQPRSEMQLRSVAGETHAARTGAGGDRYGSPGKSASRLNFFHVCGRPALQRLLPAPAPAVRPSAPLCAVGDRPPPGLPAQRLPGRGSRLLTPRSGPGACSLPQPGSLCRLLAAAWIWPRRTRRGEGGSRRGSAAPGRRPRGGHSGRRRPNLAAQAGRCHSASPPPAAARGGVGEARPPRGRVLQGPGGCGRREIPAKGSQSPAGFSPPAV